MKGKDYFKIVSVPVTIMFNHKSIIGRLVIDETREFSSLKDIVFAPAFEENDRGDGFQLKEISLIPSSHVKHSNLGERR